MIHLLERAYTVPAELRAVLVRFMSHVIVDPNGCWLWQSEMTDNGYGRFDGGKHGRSVAHRWLFQKMIGALADEVQLDHLCRVRSCVNLSHLEPVTALENVRRAASLITHCPQGHPYDEANTRLYQGRRYCRACMAKVGRTRDPAKMREYRRAYKLRRLQIASKAREEEE